VCAWHPLAYFRADVPPSEAKLRSGRCKRGGCLSAMARGRLRSGSCRVETPAPRPRHGGAPVGWSVGRTESAERNAALNKPDERPGRGGRAGCRECFSALAARRFSFDGSRKVTARRPQQQPLCASLPCASNEENGGRAGRDTGGERCQYLACSGAPCAHARALPAPNTRASSGGAVAVSHPT
jgi:hypothetical protein